MTGCYGLMGCEGVMVCVNVTARGVRVWDVFLWVKCGLMVWDGCDGVRCGVIGSDEV